MRHMTFPSWFYTGKNANAFVMRKSHGEFSVSLQDVKGHEVHVTLTKHNLRMLTLVGTLIFTDIVGTHRNVCKSPQRKRSFFKRVMIALRVLFNC